MRIEAYKLVGRKLSVASARAVMKALPRPWPGTVVLDLRNCVYNYPAVAAFIDAILNEKPRQGRRLEIETEYRFAEDYLIVPLFLGSAALGLSEENDRWHAPGLRKHANLALLKRKQVIVVRQVNGAEKKTLAEHVYGTGT